MAFNSAAWITTWRFALFVVIFVVGVSGCASIPGEVRKFVGSYNGTWAGTRTTKFAALTIIETKAFVAGQNVVKPGFTMQVQCDEELLKATVLWDALTIESGTAEVLCQNMIDGLRYVLSYSMLPEFLDHAIFRLYVVPAGYGVSVHSISWSPLGTLRPIYADRLDEDVHVDVVGRFAHEFLHMLADAVGPTPDISEENVAYMAQNCAVLDVMGSIRQRELASPEVRQTSPLPSASRTSARAAVTVDHLFLSVMNEDGLLIRDSRSGQRVLETCGQVLSQFFAGKRVDIPAGFSSIQ